MELHGIKTRAKIFQSVSSYSWDSFAHFKRSEFACRCGCGFDDEDLKVVEILEIIRKHFGGRPVIVTSGCRCVKRNNRVRTESNGSQHLYGKACDFYIPRSIYTELIKLLLRINESRLDKIYIHK